MIKNTIKRILLDAGYVKHTPGGVTIVAIHGVTGKRQKNPCFNIEGRHIMRSDFELLLKLLMRHFNAITLQQLAEYYQEKDRLPKNPLLITFDDGFANNYYQAFPILKKYGLPAAVFLSTRYLGNQHAYWVETFEYVVANIPEGQVNMDIFGERFSGDREDVFRKALKKMKSGYKYSEINALVTGLKDRFNIDIREMPANEDYCFLDWDQIREMRKNNISFGAHTHSHVNLAFENEETARDEILTSKRTIEENLQEECFAFCYPFGKSGANDDIKNMLRRHDFRLSFTLSPGYNVADSDPFWLNRFALGSGVSPYKYVWDIMHAK